MLANGSRALMALELDSASGPPVESVHVNTLKPVSLDDPSRGTTLHQLETSVASRLGTAKGL